MVAMVKLKRMGLKPGMPDLCIPVARNGYHGLYIELKRAEGGVLTEHQVFWLARLNQLGYLAVCARGYDEGMKVIQDYFKGNFKC